METARTVSDRELLLGSSFSLTIGKAEEGFVSMWGRGAVTRFEGRTPDPSSETGTGGVLSLDGEMTSAMQGTDWQRGPRTTGLAVAHSLGEGGYGGDGRMSVTLTGLYPRLHHALRDRLEAWGVAGYGAGSPTLVPHSASGPQNHALVRTVTVLQVSAAGLRGTRAEPGSGSGGISGLFDSLMLTGTTDAMVVGTSTDAVSGSGAGGQLAAVDVQVSRLRLGLVGGQSRFGSVTARCCFPASRSGCAMTAVTRRRASGRTSARTSRERSTALVCAMEDVLEGVRRAFDDDMVLLWVRQANWQGIFGESPIGRKE